MSKEAMELALEALENSVDLVREDAYQAEKLYGNYPTRQGKVNGLKVLADDHEKAITALREALAEQSAQQDSTCNNTLRAQGKAYPRTCKKCGLGPCVGLAQQALDKKAENARDLGLDYEPSNTTQMARKAGIRDCTCNGALGCLEAFAELVRADEREACAKVCENEWSNVAERMYGEECAAAIRARSNT